MNVQMDEAGLGRGGFGPVSHGGVDYVRCDGTASVGEPPILAITSMADRERGCPSSRPLRRRPRTECYPQVPTLRRASLFLRQTPIRQTNTCAQTAIVAKNKVMEASANVSSSTVRNMIGSPVIQTSSMCYCSCFVLICQDAVARRV